MSLLSKRFPTVLGLLLLGAAIAGGIYYFQGKKTEIVTEIVPKQVRITNIADNKFSVSWTTQTATAGVVEYGQVGEKLTTRAADERDLDGVGQYLTHHVTIDGLQPSTQYGFRILVGEQSIRFDNNGSPYTASTGPVIGGTPPSNNFYGNVELESKQVAAGTIVYITLPGSATASTLVTESGNYAFTLSTIRNSDLKEYVKFDPAATIASLVVEGGRQQSNVAVSLVNSAPVPTIVLGQDAEFLNLAQEPVVAEIQPEQPRILNVEPLADQNEINVVSTTGVTILNPKEVGEILYTLRPEFRGTGPKGVTLSIALRGQKAVSDTIQVAADGTWSWAPVIDLKTGKQTVSVTYLATGVEKKVEKEFTISASTTGLDPAFVATPSASTLASAQPSAQASSTASANPTIEPREAMPATNEGVPVSGVIENTLLTGALGIVIMVVGAVLLAL